LAPKVLLKCRAVVSCKLEWSRISVLDVAPTRQLKSFTSQEVMNIFDRDFYLDLRSDFTMNSLLKYNRELANGKCLFVNDGTTLLASKAQRTKERLVGGLSELLSDRKYTYQDFSEKTTLQGQVTLIMNMTSEAYQNYKNRLLFELTLSERLLTVHHVFTAQDKIEWVVREETAKKLHYDDIITVENISTDVEIPSEYLSTIERLSIKFSYNSLSSPVSSQDLIARARLTQTTTTNLKSINTKHRAK
jgi:hypothetical protein